MMSTRAKTARKASSEDDGEPCLAPKPAKKAKLSLRKDSTASKKKQMGIRSNTTDESANLLHSSCVKSVKSLEETNTVHENGLEIDKNNLPTDPRTLLNKDIQVVLTDCSPLKIKNVPSMLPETKGVTAETAGSAKTPLESETESIVQDGSSSTDDADTAAAAVYEEPLGDVVDKPEVKRCPVCQKDIPADGHSSHLASCLHDKFTHSSGNADESTENFSCCQICQKDLSHMNSRRRMQHVNRCIDQEEEKQKSEKEREKALEAAKNMVLDCPVCGQKLKTQKGRKVHMKKCAIKFSVDASTLMEIVKKQETEHQLQLAAGILLVQNDSRVKKRMQPKKKPSLKAAEPKNHLDEDTQLAMALSTSLQTDAKPANRDSLQDFMVPPAPNHPSSAEANHPNAFHILMSPKPAEPPGKKRRKKKQDEAVPQLILQTEEDLQKRLADRVAHLLIQAEDSGIIPSTPEMIKSKFKGKSAYKENGKVLWTKSSDTQDCDIMSFYVEDIMPPLEVSKVAPGSKLKSLSQIPGRSSLGGEALDRQRTSSLDDTIGSIGGLASTQTALVLAELGSDGCTQANTTSINMNTTSVTMDTTPVAMDVTPVAMQPINVSISEKAIQDPSLSSSGCHGDRNHLQTHGVSFHDSIIQNGATNFKQVMIQEDSMKRDFELDKINEESPPILEQTGFCLEKEEGKPSDGREEHVQALLTDLSSLVNDVSSGDLKIRVAGGRLLHAHRCILTVRCRHLVETVSEDGVLLLEDFSHDAVLCLLRYLYSADTCVPPVLSSEGMRLAKHVKLDSFYEVCKDIAEQQAEKVAMETPSFDAGDVDLQKLLKDAWGTDSESSSEDEEAKDAQIQMDEDLEDEVYEYMATQRQRTRQSDSDSAEKKLVSSQAEKCIIDSDPEMLPSDDNSPKTSNPKDKISRLTHRGCLAVDDDGMSVGQLSQMLLLQSPEVLKPQFDDEDTDSDLDDLLKDIDHIVESTEDVQAQRDSEKIDAVQKQPEANLKMRATDEHEENHPQPDPVQKDTESIICSPSGSPSLYQNAVFRCKNPTLSDSPSNSNISGTENTLYFNGTVEFEEIINRVGLSVSTPKGKAHNKCSLANMSELLVSAVHEGNFTPEKVYNVVDGLPKTPNGKCNNSVFNMPEGRDRLLKMPDVNKAQIVRESYGDIQNPSSTDGDRKRVLFNEQVCTSVNEQNKKSELENSVDLKEDVDVAMETSGAALFDSDSDVEMLTPVGSVKPSPVKSVASPVIRSELRVSLTDVSPKLGRSQKSRNSSPCQEPTVISSGENENSSSSFGDNIVDGVEPFEKVQDSETTSTSDKVISDSHLSNISGEEGPNLETENVFSSNPASHELGNESNGYCDIEPPVLSPAEDFCEEAESPVLELQMDTIPVLGEVFNLGDSPVKTLSLVDENGNCEVGKCNPETLVHAETLVPIETLVPTETLVPSETLVPTETLVPSEVLLHTEPLLHTDTLVHTESLVHNSPVLMHNQIDLTLLDSDNEVPETQNFIQQNNDHLSFQSSLEKEESGFIDSDCEPCNDEVVLLDIPGQEDNEEAEFSNDSKLEDVAQEEKNDSSFVAESSLSGSPVDDKNSDFPENYYDLGSPFPEVDAVDNQSKSTCYSRSISPIGSNSYIVQDVMMSSPSKESSIMDIISCVNKGRNNRFKTPCAEANAIPIGEELSSPGVVTMPPVCMSVCNSPCMSPSNPPLLDEDGDVWEDFDDAGYADLAASLPSSASQPQPQVYNKEASIPSIDEAQRTNQGPSDVVDDDCMTYDPPTDLDTDMSALVNDSTIIEEDEGPVLTQQVKALKTPACVPRKRKTKKPRIPPSPFTPAPDFKCMVTPDLKKECKKYGVRPLPKKKMINLLQHIYTETHQLETDSEYDCSILEENRSGNVQENLFSKDDADLVITTEKVSLTGSEQQTTQGAAKSRAPAKGRKFKFKATAKLGSRLKESQNTESQKSTDSTAACRQVDSDDSSQGSGGECPLEESIWQGAPQGDGEEPTTSRPGRGKKPANKEECTKLVSNFIKGDQSLYQAILQYQPMDFEEFKQKLKEAKINIPAAMLLDILDDKCIAFTMRSKEKKGGPHTKPKKRRK